MTDPAKPPPPVQIRAAPPLFHSKNPDIRRDGAYQKRSATESSRHRVVPTPHPNVRPRMPHVRLLANSALHDCRVVEREPADLIAGPWLRDAQADRRIVEGQLGASGCTTDREAVERIRLINLMR
jgi:hypothetical protein